MTEEQLYLCKNGLILSINSCDCASQVAVFDLEKYEPYINKIRALFVPSLEFRIRFFMEEFVYSMDSRLATQFPYLRKFVDTTATWIDFLNKIVGNDIGMTEETMIGRTVKCALKDNLITCLLNSIVLHHRLNKICRELDALGIEDNIFRRFNVWNFVNERNYWLDHDCSTNSNTAADCDTNSSVGTSCDAKEPARCEKAVQPSAATSGDVYCDQSTGSMRPITSYHCARSKQRQIFLSNRHFHRRTEDNSNHSKCGTAAGSSKDEPDKARCRSSNEKSRDNEAEQVRSVSRLKVILRRMYLVENCCRSTFSSGPVVTRLSLPCKHGDLIRRIFEADPSLAESCLILMKRKFEISIYNVCSCLNDVLGKLDDETSRATLKALYLSCEIRPGYISFKLKTDGASGANKCLFVARVPICQNVRKCTLQRDSVVSIDNPDPRIQTEGSNSERCKNDDNNFNDILARIEEESESSDDTCCSNRSSVKDTATYVSQDKVENNKKENILSSNETISRHDNEHELTICSYNRSFEKIDETMTLCTDEPEGRNKECCEALGSVEEDNDAEKRREEIRDSDSITKNDEARQPANDVNCACSSYENVAETNNEGTNTSGNKNSDSLSLITNVDKRELAARTSSEESKPENADWCTNVCSITSFAQNSERDKQLVELNCNGFRDAIVAADKQSETGNNSALNSPKVEIGCCDSRCSCRHDDFIDITVIEGDDEEGDALCALETNSRNNPDVDVAKSENARAKFFYSRAAKISSKDDNSLTISVQTPRLKVSSKGINVDISYPRTVVWLASGDDNIVVKTRDRRNEPADFSAGALTIPRRGDRPFRNVDKKKLFNADSGRIRPLVESSAGYPSSEERIRSIADPTSSNTSTEEYLRAAEPSTCVTSNMSGSSCCPFVTGEFRKCEFTRSEFEGRRNSNERNGKFRKCHDDSRKLGRCIRASSSNGVGSVTSVKCRETSRRRRRDYPAEVRPQTVFATTKLRDSVDNSFDRIKRMISAKLAKLLLLNNRSKTTSTSETLRKDEEFCEDIARRKDYGTTTSSIPDRCRRGCAMSRESSDVILSICRNRGKEKCVGGMWKIHRLADDNNEILSSFRKMKNFPWYYDTSIIVPEYLEKWKSTGKEEIRRVRNAGYRSENARRCDFRNHGTCITISSRSTEISLTGNDSKCYERYTCKQQKAARDSKCVCKQNPRDGNRRNIETRRECRRYGDVRKGCRRVPIKYTSHTSVFSGVPSSFTRTEETGNIREQSRSASKNAKMRFPYLSKNREILEKDSNKPDPPGKDRLRRRRAFAILTDTYHDCSNDLDLDFKSQLSRYVKLCKNVKRSLMRTLQPDDIYEVSTASMPGSDA